MVTKNVTTKKTASKDTTQTALTKAPTKDLIKDPTQIPSEVFPSKETPKESPFKPSQPKAPIDEAKLRKLNSSAYFILDNMHPGMKQEFDTACKDFGMKDIGIYLMGLLNRLYKTVDYYNPDFEPEWENRILDLNDDLICQNCGKDIEDPEHIRQIYCCNLCAKEARDKAKTGVVYPTVKDHGSEAEQDEKAWIKEQKRMTGEL